MGKIIFQKNTFTSSGFKQVVEGLFNKCTQKEMVQFTGLARRIWLRRNDLIHGGILSHPNIIMQNTIKVVREYSLAQTRKEQCAHQCEVLFAQVWKAPVLDWCKGNWDVALERILVEWADSWGNLLAAQCVTK
jgi:hypothetical protein